MSRISELATPVNKDGGRDFGGLLGAIIGAGLAYWALPATAFHSGIIIVVAVAFGATLGIIVGIVIGALVDSWLAPKVEQTIDNAPTEQRPRNRSKMQ